MPPRRARFLSVALALAATVLPAQDLPDHRVHLPDGERPAVLERASQVEGLVALTLGAQGSRAAVATFDADAKRSTVQLFTESDPEPRILSMSGRVRDVQFSFDGEAVYALLAKETKKRVADTQLMRIDFAKGKARSVMRVPPTATAMDLWHEKNSLLIASLDAVRTVTIPGLRSGPLYAVPGQNLAIVSIGGSSRLLIGQSASLKEVDLDDPPGETSLPIRDQVATAQPVVALAAASDGSHALARMADGALALVRFDPLRIREVGRADAIAELEPRPVDGSGDLVPEAPLAETAASPEEEPEPVPEDREDEAGEFTVSGRLLGPAADRVVAVVILGPDNLLREAARVRPWADGKWETHLTQPGRYRLQLDGGGGQVLLSEPSFRLIELGDGTPPVDMDFRVLRVL